jgi:hypothetical protein
MTKIKFMGLFNKLFSVIAVFISLPGFALADSTGITFNWQPFVVNDYLKLNSSSGNDLLKNTFLYEKIRGRYEDKRELWAIDLTPINNSPAVNVKKSILDNIKITFSPVDSFMMPGDEMYSRGKDGKLSRITKTLPSFFQNPSQGTTVEMLKLIEPQVNFGFEF